MELTIYRDGSSLVNLNLDNDSKQVKSFMGEDLISLRFELADYIEFKLGDYLTIDGQDYTLNQLPTVVKHSSVHFSYEAKFEGELYDLINVIYRGTGGNVDHYLEGTVADFMDLLVSNANRVYGSGTWSHDVNLSESNYRNIQFQASNCLQALKKVVKQFGVEFRISDKTIYIRDSFDTDTGLTLEYGHGGGLYEITRSRVDSQNLFTRLYVRGSQRNLTSDYRSHAQRLMLPGGEEYLESNVSTYGVIEKSVIFDNIYPHYTGSVTAVDSEDERIFDDSNLDFNVNDYLISTLEVKIHFNTGNLAGNEFKISGYNHNDKRFTLIKNEDEQEFELPNDTLKPEVGDQYVILNISMPQSYIDNAESELENKATKYLNANDEPRVKYNVRLTPSFFQDDPYQLIVGDWLTVDDPQFGNKYVQIIKRSKTLIERAAHGFEISIEVSDLRGEHLSLASLYEDQQNISQDLQQVVKKYRYEVIDETEGTNENIFKIGDGNADFDKELIFDDGSYHRIKWDVSDSLLAFPESVEFRGTNLRWNGSTLATQNWASLQNISEIGSQTDKSLTVGDVLNLSKNGNVCYLRANTDTEEFNGFNIETYGEDGDFYPRISMNTYRHAAGSSTAYMYFRNMNNYQFQHGNVNVFDGAINVEYTSAHNKLQGRTILGSTNQGTEVLNVHGNHKIVDGWIGTDNFSSETSGWRMNYEGHLDSRSILTDEMIAKSFIVDVDLALMSGHIVTKSVTQLSRDFTVPATGNTGALYVESLPGYPSTAVFTDNDYIRLQIVDRSGGGLTWVEVWATVNSGTFKDQGGGEQSYTVTIEDDGGSSGSVVRAGSTAQDYGQSGDGFIQQEAGYGSDRPWLTISTWSSEPWNPTLKTRIGNINGVTNASGYGIYSDNAFLTNSLVAGDLGKNDNYIEYKDGVMTIDGTVIVQGGSGIGVFSDAGDFATQNSADWSSQIGGTGKPDNNADVTADNSQSYSWLSDSSLLVVENDSLTRLTDTDLDNIEDTDNYKKIKATQVSAGEIILVANGSSIKLDAVNNSFSINNETFGETGIQAEYNNGTPRFFVGQKDGSYLKWDGSDLISQGTFRTSENGKRIELRSSNNTMGFINSDGEEVIIMDDEQVENNPGILLRNGSASNHSSWFQIGAVEVEGWGDDGHFWVDVHQQSGYDKLWVYMSNLPSLSEAESPGQIYKDGNNFLKVKE